MGASDTGRTTQQCPGCAAAIDVSSAEPLARVSCPNCGEKVRVDRAFDNFVLLETLGVGGMGSVYKARDTRLDRFVALKLLRSELSANAAEAARLQQEARATAAVNHSHVVQVFSSGYDHGQFYLVMELVDRGSLDDLMAQQARIPEAQVLQIGIQIAQGLRAACEKGLIHRDVKPANILFADAETAKIGDFGLAIAAEQKAEAQNEIWGTPYYVAPERLRSEPEDSRSDIYSLGATLFHVLAGKPPIEGESNSATQLLEMKQRVVDLRRVAPEVSRATAKVINRALAADPRLRFQSYDELIRELQRARALLLRDPAAQRKQRLLIAAAVLVVALVATLLPLRLRSKPPPVAQQNNSAAVDSLLQKSFEDARRQLIAGKTDAARNEFARLADQAKDRQPLLDWIRLHRGLASLLRGYSTQARQSFEEVANAGERGDLGKFFINTARTMASPAVIRSSDVADANARTPEAFALFLFAMKDWQQRAFKDAAALLERFERSQVPPAFSWINDYKPFAQKYLADFARYAALDEKRELQQQLDATRDVLSKLQTHGAMVDALKEQESAVSRKLNDQQQAANASREQQRKQQLESETPILNAATAAYRQKLATYDFDGALAAAESAQVTEPGLKSQRDALVQKARWLVQWKEQCITAINQRGFSGNIRDKMNVTYVGIAKASPNRISMKLPYGQAEIEWTKLTPQTLLAVSTALIAPHAADAADRQWRSAIFAAETGQSAEAQKLGDTAASTKPEYRESLRLLRH
jgi:serine/threonine protein kinase